MQQKLIQNKEEIKIISDLEEVKIAQQIHYIPTTKQKLSKKLSNTIKSLKITSIGNVDSGKSTLISVLTKGIADDGRGAARKRVFNYPHEEETGRTSSVGHEIMGFDEHDIQVLPDRYAQNKNKYWSDIMQNTSKVITFLDLCGHEKYLKTTIYGLMGMQPDYAMIIVGGNQGLSRMTKEHLGLALALKIPFFVVVTKIDMTPENVYQDTMAKLNQILKYQNVNRLPFQIKSSTEENEILTVANSMQSNRICPIFSVSSVSMQGIPQLKYFLSKLPIKNKEQEQSLIENPQQSTEDQLLEFDINETFLVPGVGMVVSGIMKSGTAKLNQIVQLGPDKAKQFKTIIIKSIHVNRTPMETAVAGQCACFAIKNTKNNEKLTRDDFRKGMVLLDTKISPNPVREFIAEVVVLHHSTTINPGYQSVLHCGVIRQCAEVLEIQKGEFLRTNDKDIVRFRFQYSPEIIKIGEVILLREGRTKIVGNVVELVKEEDEMKKKKEFIQKKVEKSFG